MTSFVFLPDVSFFFVYFKDSAIRNIRRDVCLDRNGDSSEYVKALPCSGGESQVWKIAKGSG